MSSLSPLSAADPAPVTGCSTMPPRQAWHLRGWRGFKGVLRAALWCLLVLWSTLLLAWLILHWGILPHIANWRGAIEARASSALGVPVRIGDIRVHTSGWVPSVELSQVMLLDNQARPALVLPRVVAALSPQSLLAWDLRFQQLYLEGAQLDVRRDARGRIFVAGFDLDASQVDPAEEGAALRWFLKQPEFVIRGGSLRWTDEQRGAPPLTLTDVQLVLRNGLRRHQVQLNATPPADWGERFSLRGRFTQPLVDGEDFKRWSGSAYAELPRADVRQLQRYLSLPFSVSEGDGAVRAWVDIRQGVPQAATVDMALRAVTLQIAKELQPLALARIEGRLSARREAEGVRLAAEGLSFHTGDGLHWPRGDLQMTWRQREGGPTLGGTFDAQQLDIGVLARVAAALPLGAPLRQLLAETRPEGLVSALSLRFDGPLDAPTGYQLKGQVSGLSMAAGRGAPDASGAPGIGRPGLQQADLQIDANERGGQASLKIGKGRLVFPGVFDEPELPLDQLAASLAWQIEPAAEPGRAPTVRLEVKDVVFANADAKGSLSGSWRTGPGTGVGRGARYPGQLTLEGQLDRGVAARTARYLPRGIDAHVRDYVARAVQGGRLGQTVFKVKGDLWDFPFWGGRDAAAGEFRIAGQVEDLTLAYLPDLPARADQPAWVSPWPALTQLSGELVFDRAAMQINGARARIGGVQLSKVNGGIADLADRATLAIEGQASGPAGEMLRFVQTTPVGGWIGDALATASASGQAGLQLSLNIPLADSARSTVTGQVQLAGNDLRLRPELPLLAQARGRVDFDLRGFQVVGASARVFGGEASFDGGTQADGSLRFNAQGTATAEALRRASEFAPLDRVATVLNGQAAYRLALGFSGDRTELNLSSNLVGMAIDLPAPLRKAAETPLALRYQAGPALPAAPGVPGPGPERLRLELGSLVQAQFERQAAGEGLPMRVLRGGIGVNEAAPWPAQGVAALLNLGLVDADAWQAVQKRFEGTAPPRPGPAGAGEASAIAPYLPTQVALRAQQLQFGERTLSKLTAGLSNDKGNWRANLDAEQLAGYVEYRPPVRGTAPAAAGRVYARLSRLSLPRQDVAQVENLLDQQQPESVPALDIVVDELELRGKRLGRVEIEAVNRLEAGPSGLNREWRMNRLRLTTPEARLDATGSWLTPSGPGSRRRSVMNFKLDLADGGAFLDRLGTERAIRGGKGQLSGRIDWLGSPLSLDYETLSGQVNVAIESGQFLKADPGAARLLGVLSLQALPRRLSLDFRDVFQQGFAFDNISGDVSVAEGVAHTNNLRMRGVQAVVLMEGMADVERETQDLRVIVVPEINAGTASLAYAAINPAVGLGTFLAQLVLRRPLVQAGTREFHVSGSWADPKVERIERKFNDPVPAVDGSGLATPSAAGPPAVTEPVR
jgi:uncharacterized protein (TIGR02099 family)